MIEDAAPVFPLKVGDSRFDDKGKVHIWTGDEWLTIKNVIRLLVTEHLPEVMDDLLVQADESEDGDPANDGFAERLSTLVIEDIFDCALDGWE